VLTYVAAGFARYFHSSPLRHATIRLFYLGSVGTSLGYTMQATVGAWLMATLTPSALMVALVQTSSTAPSMLFGLLAGALADMIDRRRVILGTQVLLLAATAILGATALAGWISPWALLGLTFLIGTGFTFYMPAQQATVNDLVGRSELAEAVALGSIAFNVARAVGPALAGALTSWVGTGSALLASSLFFVIMIVATRGWRSPPPAFLGIPDTLLSGVASGLRYARHSPPLRAFIVRNFGFSVCASALWGLLPVIARDQFALGAGGYGILFGCFGAGAMAGALSVTRQLRRMRLNTIVTSGMLLWAVAMLLMSLTSNMVLAVVASSAAGAAWVGVLSSLSAGTQSEAPAWVRARAVATNMVTTQASLALGSVLWGTLASYFGTRIALGASAGTLVLLILLTRSFRVALGSEGDAVTSFQLPDLAITVAPLPDDGPVLIQIDYAIAPERVEEFLRAVHGIEPMRRRNGASNWRIFRDLEHEGRFLERYIINSWAEYIRQRARWTVADWNMQERVHSLQRPDVPIMVSRLIGVSASQWQAGTSPPPQA
jgi:MFS family permease